MNTVSKTIEEMFEEIRQEVCDKICKYRDNSVVNPETGVFPECMECPLDRLF